MFGYLRLFSILCLLATAVMATAGGLVLRSLATDDLTQLAETGSIGIAQGYNSIVWKKYRDVILPLAANPALMKDNPEVAEFAQDTVHYFQNIPMVRVNIYSASSTLLLTVNTGGGGGRLYGNAASPDSAFAAGRIKTALPASKLLSDVPLQNGGSMTLLQTMTPLRSDKSPNEGSLEILTDVTAPWQQVVRLQMFIIGGIIVFSTVFLSVVFFGSKKAEAIIGRQHEANLELAETAAAAQAENRDKSQFLANVSHELRTPLNAIIGFSDIIKTEIIARLAERKYDDYINDIHASGVHLLSLINDILDFSKAEAGKLELEVSEVNVARTVQNCLRLVAPRAESGQVKLSEALPRDHLVIFVDSKKFKQIMLNLLSNAVKFTPAGGEVCVTGWRNVSDDTFTFEVRDTGIGIAPKDISRAMSPFGQVDNTLKRKYEGTGLGLPLTKKFVELMGGKFTIESELNVGTKITFTLPRELTTREGVVVKQASD